MESNGPLALINTSSGYYSYDFNGTWILLIKLYKGMLKLSSFPKTITKTFNHYIDNKCLTHRISILVLKGKLWRLSKDNSKDCKSLYNWGQPCIQQQCHYFLCERSPLRFSHAFLPKANAKLVEPFKSVQWIL